MGVVLIQGTVESPMEGTIYKTVATFCFYFCIYSFKICRHRMCVDISLCVYMCMCLHVSQIGHHLDCISFWGGASHGICTLSSQLGWLPRKSSIFSTVGLQVSKCEFLYLVFILPQQALYWLRHLHSLSTFILISTVYCRDCHFISEIIQKNICLIFSLYQWSHLH